MDSRKGCSFKIFSCYHAELSAGNSFPSILVNEMVVEGVEEVRDAVYSHYASHFMVVWVNRPDVDNLVFCTVVSMGGGTGG